MPTNNLSFDPPIDWRDHLTGNDPYLVWAELTEGRGFEAGKIQVAVETSTANPPWNKYALEPEYEPLDICSTGAAGGGSFWTGTIAKSDDLKTLIEHNRNNPGKQIRLEFNQPRKNLLADIGGNELVFAPPVELAKNIVAVIDIGCAFAHRQFLSPHGGKLYPRVRLLWDQDPYKTARRTSGAGEQTKHWWPVQKFLYGRELTATDIEAVISASAADGEIDEDAVYLDADYAVMNERRTHGTHVLDVLAGQVNPVDGNADAASEADIIFVQLPIATVADTSGGSMTKYVLDALDYIFSKTGHADNLVINLSFGSTAGPHDGSSMLERAMDRLIQLEQARHPARNMRLVLPAGNYFLTQLHSSLRLGPTTGDLPAKFVGRIYWQIMPDDRTDTYLELWYPQSHAGEIVVAIESPCKKFKASAKVNIVAPIDLSAPPNVRPTTVGAIIHSRCTPNGENIMVLIALGPTHADVKNPISHGIWTVTVSLKEATAEVVVMAWVERDDPIAGQQGQPQSFLLSNRSERGINSDDRLTDTVKRQTTGNSLANGLEPIVVGSYIKSSLEVSAYSAAGPTLNTARASFRSWPDMCAPADESGSLSGVLAAGTRSGIFTRMGGTSVAAPLAARAILNAWAGHLPTPSTSAPPATFSNILRQRQGARWLD